MTFFNPSAPPIMQSTQKGLAIPTPHSVAILFAVLITTAWLAVSILLTIRLRVFSSAGFNASPTRNNRFPPEALFVTIVAYIALSVAGISAVQLVLPKVSFDSDLFTVIALLVDSVAKLLADGLILIIAARTVVGGLQGFGLALRQTLSGIRAGFLTAFILAPAMFVTLLIAGQISDLIRKAPPPNHQVLETLSHHPPLWMKVILVVVACVAAPITEEIAFRGMLQTVILRLNALVQSRLNPGLSIENQLPPASSRWLAITVTSVLFVSVHFSLHTLNFEVFPPLLLLSLTLGYLYERTGNLWASITLHALFNTINTILFLNN